MNFEAEVLNAGVLMRQDNGGIVVGQLAFGLGVSQIVVCIIFIINIIITMKITLSRLTF